MPITLPITPTNLFGNATVTIPLSNLDNNFSQIFNAVDGIGNGTVQLATGNIGNLTTTGFLVGNVASNALPVNVTLGTGSSYADGPNVVTGTTGTWRVDVDTTISIGNGTTFKFKLWDNTTVIASTVCLNPASDFPLHLGGVISSPAAALRLSGNQDGTSATFSANVSGNGRDSTITAVRIS